MRLVLLLSLVLGSAAWAEVTGQSVGSVSEPSAKTPSFGLNVEPIYLLVHGLGAKADVIIAKKLSAGLQGIYIPSHATETTKNSSNTTPYNWSYQEFNLGVNYMITGDVNHDGFYINPAVGYYELEITNYSFLGFRGEESGPQGRLTAGYQIVNNKNNLRLAFGGGIRTAQSSDIVIRAGDGTEISREKNSQLNTLALDLQIGILF